MTDYPTPGDYLEAVQLPEAAFLDPALQRADVEVAAWGLPRAITGAYAVVFPMASRAGRWAVKCFLGPDRNRVRRYRAIEKHLRAHPDEALVGFDFQEAGIRVGEDVFPILKMAWAEGVPLNRFVEAHLQDPAVLAALNEAWAALQLRLEASGIVHGDLQHGNVFVQMAGGRPVLRLVDYDTMFVPGLRLRQNAEAGHRNYQHPDRGPRDVGIGLDRFSALVIYTAVAACRHDPALWSRFDTGENLLFSAGDFYAPDASPLFERLAAIEAIRRPVAALRMSCMRALPQIPPLHAVHGGRQGSEAVRPEAGSPARRPARRAKAVSAGRLLWGVLLVGLLICGGVAMGLGAPRLGLALAVLAVAIALGAGGWAYRRSPLVRRRQRLRSERQYIDRVIARLTAEARRRRTAFEQLLDQRSRLRGERLAQLRAEALAQRLKHHFIHEALRDGVVTHKVIVRLKSAGLRTAVHVTPARLDRVVELGEASRERLLRWRQELEARYQAALPTALSKAQTLQLERTLAQRRQAYQDEAARLARQIEVQQAERERIVAQQAQLPPAGIKHLVQALAGQPLPAFQDAPPPPTPPPEQPAHLAPAGGARTADTDPDETDPAAWWRQRDLFDASEKD